MIILPSCDALFLKFFDPWYKDEWRKQRPFKGVYPDITQHPSFVGLSQMQASPLDPPVRQKIEKQISGMVEAARTDMRGYLKVGSEIDLTWIQHFDLFANRSRVKDLIDRSDPTTLTNLYAVTSCEFGAAVSHILRTALPRLVWRLDVPYWDSSLLDPKTGTAIAVFHWGIKKLSEYGIGDGYAPKIKACLQFLNEERKL
jgi:hypothetical protein